MLVERTLQRHRHLHSNHSSKFNSSQTHSLIRIINQSLYFAYLFMFLIRASALSTPSLTFNKVSSAAFAVRLLLKPKALRFHSKMSTSLAAQGIVREEGGEEDRILVDNMHGVRERMDIAARNAERDPATVRLVAVSKTKPVEDIRALYNAGQRHFGENYFQELLEKAPLLPNDICWHFIGHLQSSKSNKLVRDVPNLYMVETVDTDKLAGKLNAACELAGRTAETPLRILIQVDTSGEDTKSGIDQEQIPELVRYIKNQCPLLHIQGVMTIGAPGDSTCFDRLVAARRVVAETLNIADESSLELSMGMSGDFPEAIAKGATSVRVGSTIFGPRAYPPKK